MSASSSVLIKRLSVVQKNLMGKEIKDYSLNFLIPLIFEECLRENMTFYFNFIENQAVLNLCDLSKEHSELHFRLSHDSNEMVSNDTLKIFLLENTFLLLKNSVDVASSENITKEAEKNNESIQESNMVPPSAIRVAMEECKNNNEELTRKNIEKKLNLKAMSKDKRHQCIAYLRSMEAA